ncbi:MAG: glycosyltransferase family 9 protein [Desulfovibrionaceae bacterium]
MKSLQLDRPGSRLLIFRNGKIGNTLMALGVAQALKSAFHELRLDMVVDHVGLDLLQDDPRLGKLFVFERDSDSLASQWRLARSLRRERYAASIHCRTGVRNEILALLAGIPNRIGYRLKGSPQLLTCKHPKHNDRHVLASLESLVQDGLGLDLRLERPRLHERPDAAQAAGQWLQEQGLAAGEYMVWHPAGQTSHGVERTLNWHAEAMVRLQQKLDLPVAIVGAGEEKSAILRVLPEGVRVHPFFGQSVSKASSIIKNARLFVGNDSGPAHLAEAWDVPKVVVYQDDPGNFVKWRPLDEGNALPIFAAEADTDAAWAKIEAFAESRSKRSGA